MGFSDFFKGFDKPKGKITMPTGIPSKPAVDEPKYLTIGGKKMLLAPAKDAPMKWKAGGFPFFRDEAQKIWVCLFKSNDANYGGSAYQMPKGHPDKGESPGEAAAREAMEETGIPERVLSKNRRKVDKFVFKGEISTYLQYVYVFPLDTKFPATTNNEGMGKWVNYEYALTVIRKDQRGFLKKAREEFIKYEKSNRST